MTRTKTLLATLIVGAAAALPVWAGMYDYSTTAASNATVGAVNFAEGQAPSTVNDSARALMADLAKFRDDIAASKTTTGSAGGYALTSSSTITTLADGQIISFIANHGNTGAATLNVDGAGVKALRKFNDEALIAGDVRSGGAYMVVYDASKNSAAGAWLLLNPSEIQDDQLPSTVAMLDEAETVSAAWTFTGGPTISGAQPSLTFDETDESLDWQVRASAGNFSILEDANIRLLVDASANQLRLTSTNLTWDSSIVWEAGNDGAGSGLDADLLDGQQGAAYASLAGTETFSGQKTFSAQTTITSASGLRLDGSVLYGYASAGSADANPPASPSVGLAINGTAGTVRSNSSSAATATFGRSGTNGAVVNFYKTGVLVGSVSVTGVGTTYNTTSDERLKKSRRDLKDAVDVPAKIRDVRINEYEFTSEPGVKHAGPDAQELYALFPDVVTPGIGAPGDADYVPWMWDPSKMVPYLIVDNQVLRGEVNALAARVATLEARTSVRGGVQ